MYASFMHYATRPPAPFVELRRVRARQLGAV
jgi:hypothetical protein